METAMRAVETLKSFRVGAFLSEEEKAGNADEPCTHFVRPLLPTERRKPASARYAPHPSSSILIVFRDRLTSIKPFRYVRSPVLRSRKQSVDQVCAPELDRNSIEHSAYRTTHVTSQVT